MSLQRGVNAEWLEKAIAAVSGGSDVLRSPSRDEWFEALQDIGRDVSEAELAVLKGLLSCLQLELLAKGWLGALRSPETALPTARSGTEAVEGFVQWLRATTAGAEATLADRAKIIVERDFDTAITTAELSRQLGNSSSTVRRAFRRQFGCSIKTHLKNVRVRAAIGLLKDTDLKVEAIALMVGFHGKGRFYALVKNATGLTPTGVRQRWRAEEVK